MLSNQNAGPQFEPLSVSPWTLNSTITSKGGEVINSPTLAKFGAVCQTYYPAKTGDQFLRTKQNADGDGVELLMWVHEYSVETGGGWLRRTSILSGDPYTLGANTKSVRFTFAYASSTGKSMTQNIIDDYFAVSYREV